ncbi:MAG TPA: hypothetical protein VMM55_06095 [Thermohalobaculum sp.]|nr:hypothetical protein [Thermohalobaculum sp.]
MHATADVLIFASYFVIPADRAVPMQLRGEARAESGDGFYRYELTAPLAPSESFAVAYG